MNAKQKRVAKLSFPGIDNAYILVSGREKKHEGWMCTGETWANPTVSFLYDAGDICAEWEPEFGPIQLWYRCDKDAEGAREHYYYDYENGPLGSWAQTAVYELQLPQAFIKGDFAYIFMVLKDWAERG